MSDKIYKLERETKMVKKEIEKVNEKIDALTIERTYLLGKFKILKERLDNEK